MLTLGTIPSHAFLRVAQCAEGQNFTIGSFLGAGISVFGVLALSAIFFEAFDCEIRNDLSPIAQHLTVAVVCSAPATISESLK